MLSQAQLRKAIAQHLEPGRGVSGIAEIASAYKNDPRTQLATQGMADGSSMAPVAQGKYAYMDGIARALQGGVAGMASRQQQDKYGAATDSVVALDKGRAVGPLDPVAIAQSAPPAPQSAAPAPAMPPMAPVPPPALPAPQAAPMAGGQPGVGQRPFVAASTPGFDLGDGAATLKAAGAKITSGHRTPEQQQALIAKWEAGGRKGIRPADNSYHLQGDDAHPQALDWVPKPGESMAQLEKRVRVAYPGYDVINEGTHVHVEPSKAMSGTAPRVSQVDAFTQPVAETVPDLPTPVARPTPPQAVAAGKSPLLKAAYDLMLNGNEWTHAASQRMYEGGLAEQNQLNEAAVGREQSIRNAGYATDNSIYANSVERNGAAKIADRASTIAENRKDEDAFTAYQRESREKALDRAERANEANLRLREAGMKLDAKGSKPLSATAVDKLTKAATALDSVNMLGATFKDHFVGRPVFGATGIAINKVVGGDQELGQWWQNYQGWIADIRKMYFGSAFTPNEQRQFDKFVVTPSMDAKLARQNIQRQQGIAETALGRTSRSLSAEYNPDAVREAIGRDPASLGTTPPVAGSATPPPSTGWGKVTVVK